MPTDPNKKDRIDVWCKKGTKKKLASKAKKENKTPSKYIAEGLEKLAE